MLLLHLFVTFCIIISVRSQYFDYYWRDYYGVIPEDALPGGEDINGIPVYIGQAYIHNLGLSVGLLSPGKTEIAVPFYGVKKQNYLIKILCTRHPEHFFWFRTDRDSYHVNTINKHPVVGGYDHNGNKGILHVGRVMHQGTLRFGNVASYDANAVYLYFPNGDKEERARYYEVLVYNNGSINDIISNFI